ncbi:MAG: coproporphyrinogen III oxidase, partial [Staphylococcus equorum]|nr:coproporphyrinogen III oxidase [Staphylococcus equorum]
STFPTETEQMEEEMFLGLRMNIGVDKDKFSQKFGKTLEEVYGQTIEDLIQRELLIDQNGHITMTERGKVIGNIVFEAFLLNV